MAHDFDGEECEKKKRFRSTCANDGNFFFSPLVSFFLLLPQPPSLSPSPLSISRSSKARRIEGNHTQPVCGEHIKIKSSSLRSHSRVSATRKARGFTMLRWEQSRTGKARWVQCIVGCHGGQKPRKLTRSAEKINRDAAKK